MRPQHVQVELYHPEEQLGCTYGRIGDGPVTVTQVTPGSAIARAGLSAGTILLGLDGKQVRDQRQLLMAVEAFRKKGMKVLNLEVVIDEEQRLVVVKLYEPSEPLGFEYERRSDALLYATHIHPGGAFHRAGIESGNVIRSVNGIRINGEADLKTALGELKQRGGSTLTVEISVLPSEPPKTLVPPTGGQRPPSQYSGGGGGAGSADYDDDEDFASTEKGWPWVAKAAHIDYPPPPRPSTGGVGGPLPLSRIRTQHESNFVPGTYRMRQGGVFERKGPASFKRNMLPTKAFDGPALSYSSSGYHPGTSPRRDIPDGYFDNFVKPSFQEIPTPSFYKSTRSVSPIRTNVVEQAAFRSRALASQSQTTLSPYATNSEFVLSPQEVTPSPYSPVHI